MYKNQRNAIQRARISSGLTQEALAERAGCSVDSIRKYESGERRVPEDILSIFQAILNAPWLHGVYLLERTDTLDELIPEFEVGKPQAEAVASYVSCIYDMEEMEVCRTLIRMMADGAIDDVEQPVFDKIMEIAERTTKAYFEMRFSAQKEKP